MQDFIWYENMIFILDSYWIFILNFSLIENSDRFIDRVFYVLLNTKTSTSSLLLCQVNDACTSYLLNMEERTCTCNQFQVNKISCAHALAIIAKIKKNSYSNCLVYYRTNMYIQTYSGTIFPLGDRNDWNVSDEVKTRIVLVS